MSLISRIEHPDESQDIAPGNKRIEPDGIASSIRGYVIGLVLAGGLTAASFLLAGADLVYGPGIPVALLVLAVAQMGVHLVFFLHITTAPDNTNNVMALAFGVLICVLVIGGTIWIMSHLNHNMQPADPMGQVMQMPM